MENELVNINKIGKLKKYWYELKMYEKVSFILACICSMSIIILAALFLLNIITINISTPLLGILFITSGLYHLRKNKIFAILNFCVGIFSLITTFIIIVFLM